MNAHSRLADAFAKEHPTRTAQLAETSLAEEFGEFLEQLAPPLAARIVARAAPLAAASAISKMGSARASDVLGELNPRIAAALLRRMDKPAQEALRAALPTKVAKQLHQILSYRSDQTASRMDPRAPAVGKHVPVEHAMQLVRNAQGGALHYVYVIDEEQRLCGVCSMRELMCADPHDLMVHVMVETPLSLLADDPLDSVVVHAGWKKVHALPVVDTSGRFVGVIRYSAFRALEAELGKVASSGSRHRTSNALGELFWLGASAMAHLGEAALLGRDATSKDTNS